MKIYAFDQLSNCDLIIDAIYEGGNSGNLKDDPINKLLSVGNQGGFRFSVCMLHWILIYVSLIF